MDSRYRYRNFHFQVKFAFKDVAEITVILSNLRFPVKFSLNGIAEITLILGHLHFLVKFEKCLNLDHNRVCRIKKNLNVVLNDFHLSLIHLNYGTLIYMYVKY